MSLVSLIIALVVVGFLLWAVNTFIPLDGKVKTLLNVVIIIVLVLYVLDAFGVFGALSGARVPRVD